MKFQIVELSSDHTTIDARVAAVKSGEAFESTWIRQSALFDDSVSAEAELARHLGAAMSRFKLEEEDARLLLQIHAVQED